jgi:hypothetical protein
VGGERGTGSTTVLLATTNRLLLALLGAPRRGATEVRGPGRPGVGQGQCLSFRKRFGRSASSETTMARVSVLTTIGPRWIAGDRRPIGSGSAMTLGHMSEGMLPTEMMFPSGSVNHAARPVGVCTIPSLEENPG